MGYHYWRAIACNYKGKEHEFKEVVVKDAEVLGVLAALLVTVALAGLSLTDGGFAMPSTLRTSYVTVMFFGLCSSGLALYISSRNVLTLNKIPADEMSQLLNTLEEVDQFELASSPLFKRVSRNKLDQPAGNAFPLFVMSLLSILVGAVLGIQLLYDDLCTMICVALALVTVAYASMVELNHGQAVRHFVQHRTVDSSCESEEGAAV
mmetsp:Transcript_88888/g.157458  ORF Transcript_88888/g.157458 Transcript_88888/m.157458 type:complete len:207 (-) Transcript_88888:84-704(-)|eukprot:CAMPEP_0197640978 /NCGR_PEP_ID=MMETSP1338-20131121/15082_1 /TAXON_ID=43686 ORGANISM="Pelagodinium beii, Strain RCC1491" /NCGR_SAMPLE_ID=MMETSP1338 /ASSEMBLY_ACC=CAM_ASM_000754 /LENGTH=206 /DNA_ID=CAMNT_0043213875 /DNA_START=32 /DNA_END=652 /DNA_ORIENTATION=-